MWIRMENLCKEYVPIVEVSFRLSASSVLCHPLFVDFFYTPILGVTDSCTCTRYAREMRET